MPPPVFTREMDPGPGTTLPRKPGPQIDGSQGGTPQILQLAHEKRSWTEKYEWERRTATVQTWLDQVETWFVDGVELTNTHPVTGDPIDCYIADLSKYKVDPPDFVMGLTIVFIES